MANIKITELPVITTAQITDVDPTVQSGTTYQRTNSQLITLINSVASFLHLSGGTLTGNLLLSVFSLLKFYNNDPNESFQWRFYDNSGSLNLSLDSIEGGVLKALFNVSRTDAGAGAPQFTFVLPLVSRNIGLTNQGRWFGAQPVVPVAINASSGTANTDASTGNIFSFTLSTTTTLANPINAQEGMTAQWWITQDAVTARTLTLGSDFVATAFTPAFAMSTTLSAVVCLNATFINSKWRFTFV